jgi:HEPN domain-containing protein
MLKNAYANLEDAKKGQPLDDAFFDIACYNAQQALEFILKAILLEYNVEFPTKGNEGHNILALTELVIEKTPFRFDKYEELEMIATTITMWETKSRYQTGIRTKEDTVRRVLNIYREIDEEFSKIIFGK